jgi:hypothetical protein
LIEGSELGFLQFKYLFEKGQEASFIGSFLASFSVLCGLAQSRDLLEVGLGGSLFLFLFVTVLFGSLLFLECGVDPVLVEVEHLV